MNDFKTFDSNRAENITKSVLEFCDSDDRLLLENSVICDLLEAKGDFKTISMLESYLTLVRRFIHTDSPNAMRAVLREYVESQKTLEPKNQYSEARRLHLYSQELAENLRLSAAGWRQFSQVREAWLRIFCR